MHHPVGHPYPFKEFCGPVHGLFGRIPDIIECMQNVFDNPVIPIQGEGSLEHDRSFSEYQGFPCLIFGVPEIDINGVENPAARGTFLSGSAPCFQ